MIRIKHLSHALFDLTRVRMQAGDDFLIPAAAADRSIGVFCTLGGTVHAEGQAAGGSGLPQAGQGLILNDALSGWSNPAVGHRDLNLHAPVDTEWVCVAQNHLGVRPALSDSLVQGASALAPGTGVIVIDGDIQVDGVCGGPDGFFRPREATVKLEGAGRVLLLRFAAAPGAAG